MTGSAASLNFAAYFDLAQTEAPSFFLSALIVVTLITFIEQVILKPDVRRQVYQPLLEVEAKGLAHGQALVEELLGCLSAQVRNRTSLVFSFGNNWRSWWTWRRTNILIQASLGLLVLATFSLPMVLSLNEASFDAEEVVEPKPAPCADDEIPLAGPMAQVLAPMAVFAGGALFNCKAFMRIPLL